MDQMATEMEFRFPLLDSSGEGEFSKEELDEEQEGIGFGFMRIKIPSGGQLVFEMPSEDPDRPKYLECLTGVILFQHNMNAYWPAESEDNAPPSCSALDGKVGVGAPGGSCFGCDFNKFGSGDKGRGKACKNMRVLYLLRSGDFMPIQLNLPPTSLKPFDEFYRNNFALRKRGLCGSVVEIALKKAESGGTEYSVATFKRLCDLEGQVLADAKSYSKAFRDNLKTYLQNQSDEAALEAVEKSSADYGTERFGGSGTVVGVGVVAGGHDPLP